MRTIIIATVVVATTFTTSATKSPDFVWALNFPDLGNNTFAPQVMDAAGNMYVASYPGCLLCATKVTPSGQLAWSTPLYGNTITPAFPKPLLIDSEGNTYISGHDYTQFLTWKVDPNGQVLWRAAYDPPNQTFDTANAIGRDGAGNIYVAGRSYDTAIGAAYSTTLKYDPDGHLLWARRYEGATNGIPNNWGTLAVNPHGGVAAISPASIASYSAEGDLLWSLQARLSIEAPPATFDAEDHLYVAAIDWEGEIRHTALTKFSATGEALWSAKYQNPVDQDIYPVDLKIDAQGQAYLAANSPIVCDRHYEDGELSIDCYELPLILKYNAQGEQLWASRFFFPTNFIPDVSGLALTSADEPYLAARVYRYDPTHDDYVIDEGFVGKCDVNGNQIWSGIYNNPQQQWLPSFGSAAPQTTVAPPDLLLFQFESLSRRAPNIVAPPQAQTVAPGATTTFTVKGRGEGNLSYQWRFNSRPISGANSATLTLTEVRASQAGDYSVEVRNKFGAVASPEARLSIR